MKSPTWSTETALITTSPQSYARRVPLTDRQTLADRLSYTTGDFMMQRRWLHFEAAFPSPGQRLSLGFLRLGVTVVADKNDRA